MRNIRKRKGKRVVRRRQRDVLCDVLLSARQCETWLTLDELAKLTHYPQASISEPSGNTKSGAPFDALEGAIGRRDEALICRCKRLASASICSSPFRGEVKRFARVRRSTSSCRKA
jgi:hypothetical protein